MVQGDGTQPAGVSRFQRRARARRPTPEIPSGGAGTRRPYCLLGGSERNRSAMCFHSDSGKQDKLTPMLIYSPFRALSKGHFNLSWPLNINKEAKLSFSVMISCSLQVRLFSKIIKLIQIHGEALCGLQCGLRFTHRNGVLGISHVILVLQVTSVFALPQTAGHLLASELCSHGTGVPVRKGAPAQALRGDRWD